MAFGGFAPLPMRLGGGAEDGWFATQHARLAADVAAASRTLPFAILTITRSGAGGSSPTITRHNSVASGIAGNDPIVTGNNPDPIVITWPEAPEDELGEARALRVTSVRVSRHGINDAPTSTVTAPNVVTLDPLDTQAVTATVSVYASWPSAQIEDYGGALDKRDCQTETTPHAFNWYQEIGATLGSAYGTGMRGSVHAHKLALARARAAVDRSDERFRANCTPGTASALLDVWADALSVPVAANDPEWLVRERAKAKFASVAGADLVSVEDACRSLLGDRFVSLGVNVGSALSDPPASTPPTTAWGNDFDLGNGVWATQRAHIQVYVTRPSNATDPAFLDLMNVQLMRLLDDLLPGWATFGWSVTDGEGFLLGISLLGYDGL